MTTGGGFARQPKGKAGEGDGTDLAILTCLPLLRVSSSASSCASRSIRSANLFSSRARSEPGVFRPQVVLNALRAAATATSMSLAEPGGGQSSRGRQLQRLVSLARVLAPHLGFARGFNRSSFIAERLSLLRDSKTGVWNGAYLRRRSRWSPRSPG